MTDNALPMDSHLIEADSVDRVLSLTIAANQIVASGTGENSYEMRNALLEVRRKARIRYKHGVTLPTNAEKLRADAERKVRHSRTLARNIKNATGVPKPVGAEAHHVVAQTDRRANRSRLMLFGWGIGINDVDNGVYLPKKFSSRIDGLEEATAHENIHTNEYFLAVEVRLLDAGRESERGRQTLRGIKGEILKNQFIY